MRNPKWSRDELILALELYFRVNPLHNSENHPEVIKLSNILNSLPIHPREIQHQKFRNANGVYMKLCNYLRFDSEYDGEGLVRGGKLEEIIWQEFADDRERLTRIAQAIIDAAPAIPPPKDLEEAAIDEDEEFPEGRVLAQFHSRRERNPKSVKKKKEIVIKKTGTLSCEICGFDFQKVYGELGRGYAECHHIVPLSELPTLKTIRIADLAIVCANCHRMLHRSRPWKTIDELQNIYFANK